MSIGCNTAHALKVIECYTLTGKKYADIALYSTDKLSVLYFIAILAVELYLSLIVKQGKYSCIYVKTSNDTALLAD